MEVSELKTSFAPAERAEAEKINLDADTLISLPLLCNLLDAIPDIVLILNKQRQIVFANQSLVEVFNLSGRSDLYGLRPGEALDCIHSDEHDGGCGMTTFCRTCGAVNSVLSGLKGSKRVEECRILQKSTGTAFDLRVTSSPFIINNESFVIFVATDISHEKRRSVLERTFFHDISNTLAGITNYMELLPVSAPNMQKDLLDRLALCVKHLKEEISTQRGLLSAENGDLTLSRESIRSRDFMNEMINIYRNNSVNEAVKIELDDSSTDCIFISDKTLLSRIVSNMIKNAVEASNSDDKVLTGCKIENNKISFWVHNSQHIPVDVQLQIFNRSFSTKGKGRGIGTYSIKLLSEKYLKGRVDFSTSSDYGTTFFVTIPLILE